MNAKKQDVVRNEICRINSRTSAPDEFSTSFITKTKTHIRRNFIRRPRVTFSQNRSLLDCIANNGLSRVDPSLRIERLGSLL